MQPPEELVRYFRWIASQEPVNDRNYSLIDPSQTSSEVSLELADRWSDITADRLAPFCRTGGDGSVAALWRDEEGELRFVHLGSGSGSIMVGVLANNAVDFLRLLAIGYQELCWPDHLPLTPMEAFIHENGEPDEWDDDAEPPVVPLALQQWLQQEFDADIPLTAAELTGVLPSYDKAGASDPFYQWIAKVENWHEEK
ncbi:hypothetical protein ASF16_08405 [Acidovorax sp. Leaf78]|nr:hypothetical protein ASF16_08405 [Acidovorax sp. Leaf78]